MRFDSQSTTTRQARLGMDITKKINNDHTTITGMIEGVHRFDDISSGVSGDVIGLFSFSLPQESIDNTWARVGLDIDHQLQSGAVMTSSLFASSPGQDADLSGAFSYKKAF